MISAQKLLDSWYGKGAGNLRVRSVPVPRFSRETGEAVLGHLLVKRYLQEDFHFTPYSTISYLKRGRNIHIPCVYFCLSAQELVALEYILTHNKVVVLESVARMIYRLEFGKRFNLC